MKKTFNELYNEVYNKYSKEIEQVQNERKKKIKTAAIIFGALAVVLLISGLGILIFHFAISYLVVATIVIALTSSNKKGNVYKTGVINDLVQGVFPDALYEHKYGIPRSQYNSRPFHDVFDRYSSEDMVQTRNSVNLTFSEVHTEDEHHDDDGGTTYTTSFHGIYGWCDILKSLNCKIHITSNKAFSKMNKENVQMDMPEFEKVFDVTTDNKITAVALLTADVMADILDMKKALGCMIEFVIERDKIYFRFHTGNSFEMSLFKNSMSVDVIKKYYDLLVYVEKITSKINKHIADLEI